MLKASFYAVLSCRRRYVLWPSLHPSVIKFVNTISYKPLINFISRVIWQQKYN